MKNTLYCLMIIFILLPFPYDITSAQNVKYKKLLKEEISLYDIKQNPDLFVENLRTIIYHDFDTIDYNILMGPQGDFTRIMMMTLLLTDDEKIKEQKMKYSDIKDMIAEIKNTTYYFEARKMAEVKLSLFDKVVEEDSWQEVRVFLVNIGFTDEELQTIHYLVTHKQNKETKYEEIFFNYLSQKNEEKKELIKEKNSKNLQFEKDSHRNQLVYGIPAYNNYQYGLLEAMKLNKPIFLCFNTRSSVQAREMEVGIIAQERIRNCLIEQFVIINLFTDDVQKLSEEECYYSSVLEKEIVTVGGKWLEFEVEKFKSSEQPLYVILNSKGEEINRIDAVYDEDIFNNFLLETLEKNN